MIHFPPAPGTALPPAWTAPAADPWADPPDLAGLCAALLAHPNFQEKLHIQSAYAHSTPVCGGIPQGDDTAMIRDGDSYLLFAAEGLIEAFVERDPWFAGYCAVMVNLSDIAAMGGIPIAITDVLWAHSDHPATAQIWEGMTAASQAYQVPIVGGHTTRHPLDRTPLLAAAVLGRATHPITSHEARPGDTLITVTDLDGAWRGEHSLFFNASTSTDPDRLRRLLAFPPQLASLGLIAAGKDISNGGIPGTLAMLMNTSRCGAVLDPDAVPRPPDTGLLRWLLAFPSYGFLWSVRPAAVPEILERSGQLGLTAACVGTVTDSRQIHLQRGGTTCLLAQCGSTKTQR